MNRRLGFILKGYPRVSEAFIAQEIFLLEQQGFEIEIFSMRGPRESERQPIVEKIKAPVTYLPEYLWPEWKTILQENTKAFVRAPHRWVAGLIRGIFRSLHQKNDDPIKRFLQAGWLVGRRGLGKSGHPVVHLHAHFAHAPTELAEAAAHLSGLKFSISAHAKDIYTLAPRELSRRIRASQLIMTCTRANLDFLQNLPGVTPEKVHRIYHGIDLESFHRRQEFRAQALSRFVSVGRLVEKKGYEDILEALVLLRARGHSFTYDIYGAGALLPSLRELTQKLGLSDVVRFHQTATHPQIIRRFEEGGIFLNGSRISADGDRDGIPNTVAEAMSMELPVIATAVSGIPELIEDGITGLLVDERRPDQLAEAIEKLLQNPELARHLGQRARQKVAEIFNADLWILQCAQLLQPFREAP